MHRLILICTYSDAGTTYLQKLNIRIPRRRALRKTKVFTFLDAREAEGGRGVGSNGQTEKGETERRRKEKVGEKDRGRKREGQRERERKIDVENEKKEKERGREKTYNRARLQIRPETLMTRGSPGSAFGQRVPKCPFNTTLKTVIQHLFNPPPIWGTYSVPAPAPGEMTKAGPKSYSRAACRSARLSDVRVRS